jgi:hypothetical protein
MYRYTVDNAITYTSEDFVLYRESPFACWMERLTLENPDHGIPPDVDSSPPQNTMERQDDLADTLRAEGRDVACIDWELAEPQRRTATLQAMRAGRDFIVNGQLALGPLSGSANLLMRTSGYSELGNYLYIPCDTQALTTMHSAFRLCFLADLLHSLQGQLPPQMLIIRSGAELVPLETEDHIYYFRAVKQRFMRAMSDFRKHRMPDPTESSHFGRWSDCANEVLKQRMLREEEQLDDGDPQDIALPLLQVAGAPLQEASPYDLDAIQGQNDVREEADRADPGAQDMMITPSPGLAVPGIGESVAPGGVSTLAEQALMLSPGTYDTRPGEGPVGQTPNLARAKVMQPPASTAPEAGLKQAGQKSTDVALENLEFIGSSSAPSQNVDVQPQEEVPAKEAQDVSFIDAPFTSFAVTEESPLAEPPVMPAASFLPLKPHPLDSADLSVPLDSLLDMDAVPASHVPVAPLDDSLVEQDAPPPFSSSLITNDDYE